MSDDQEDYDLTGIGDNPILPEGESSK